jgi:hypothetical protein
MRCASSVDISSHKTPMANQQAPRRVHRTSAWAGVTVRSCCVLRTRNSAIVSEYDANILRSRNVVRISVLPTAHRPSEALSCRFRRDVVGLSLLPTILRPLAHSQGLHKNF